MTNKESVGIIILNYNNWQDTINCIESIEKCNTAEIKYYVIDNASACKDAVFQLDKYLLEKFKDDYSGKIAEQDSSYIPKKVNFIVSKSNSGYAEGNNKGLWFAFRDDEVKDILIINNDVLFVSDIIPKLKEYGTKIEDCAFISPLLYQKGMKELDYNCARKNITNWNLIITYLFLYKDIGGYIHNYSEKTKILKTSPDSLSQEIVAIELPSGSCMFSSKKIWMDMGGFDNNTFLYYEENILYKRIDSIGLCNYLIPSLKCIHLGAQSSKREKSWFTLNEQFKSSIYYMEKYGDLTVFQKIVLCFCKMWFPAKIRIKKLTSF